MRKTASFLMQEDDSDIDLTPMLDVVFIMLIFFIVTATFVKEWGIDTNNPDDTNKPPPPNMSLPIIVRITEQGQIFVRGGKSKERVIDVLAIRSNIERLHAESPKSSVILQPEKKAKTKLLIEVMDQSRQAGVYNVSIADILQ